ncbi:hypothetical protein D3C87_988370 [compost metagenome]
MPEASLFQVAMMGFALLGLCLALAACAHRYHMHRLQKTKEQEKSPDREREDVDDGLERLVRARLDFLRFSELADNSTADAVAYRTRASRAEARVAWLETYLAKAGERYVKKAVEDIVKPSAVPTAPMPEEFAASVEDFEVHLHTHRDAAP